MVSINTIYTAAATICVVGLTFRGSDSFTPTSTPAVVRSSSTHQNTLKAGPLFVFGKKEPQEDLSYIESRDLTREEMLEINRRNEEVMNRELGAMTGISVLFSIPILYLCWVAFFSD